MFDESVGRNINETKVLSKAFSTTKALSYLTISTLNKQRVAIKQSAQRPKSLYDKLSKLLFPGLPEHYTLRKKIAVTKSNSNIGAIWDFVQICMISSAFALYILSTYTTSYLETNRIYTAQLVMSQFFLLDYILNFYIKNEASYMTEFNSLIDVTSILPIYISFGHKNMFTSLHFLICLRLTKLLDIFRTFKLVRNLSGINRQLVSLFLTITILVLLAAGIIQLMENTVRQANELSCQHVNALTNWQPSCNELSPSPAGCDCDSFNCHAIYHIGDADGEPTGIYCNFIEFYDAFYYVIVTIASVGYGDIKPSTIPSKAVVILLIIATFIIVPLRLSELQKLLSLTSPYAKPYIPQHNSNHVIVVFIHDKKKLERFLKEFFHPDRITSSNDYHAVILSTEEPTEEVRSVLFSQGLESKCTYVVGSALSVTDLRKVRADIASGIFFLCNADTDEGMMYAQDAANIMRALSVSNFNSSLDCFVQVLRPEDRTILKDSDVDVIICLDEFKTALQARNSVCPGFSTMIENLFHSFGSIDAEIEAFMAPWYKEYLSGAGMEFYFFQLPKTFIARMKYNYQRIVAAIYLHFDTIVVGLCDKQRTALLFNPSKADMRDFQNNEKFFNIFNFALIMSDDQHHADDIASKLHNEADVNEIVSKVKAKSAMLALPHQEHKANHQPVPLVSLKSGSSPSNEFDDDSDDDLSSDDDSDIEPEKYIGYIANRRTDTNKKGPGRRAFAGSSTTSARELDGDDDIVAGQFGNRPRQLKNADRLESHVVVFGCDANLMMFVAELRRPAVQGLSYHPIVVVSEQEPAAWRSIESKYNDVYWIKGNLVKLTVFKTINIAKSFALILLARREEIVKVDEEHIDSTTLFAYLKLESFIPKDVFFTVELNSPSNMAVLNATIMRRARLAATEEEAAKEAEAAKKSEKSPVMMPFKGMSIGSNNETKRDHRPSSLQSVSETNSLSNYSHDSALGGAVEMRNLNSAGDAPVQNRKTVRRGSVLFDGDGRFATQKGKSFVVNKNVNMSVAQQRLGNLGAVAVEETKEEQKPEKDKTMAEKSIDKMTKSLESFGRRYEISMLKEDDDLWDAMDSHHVLPVFASARAFVPSSFESLLVQSFYVPLTPIICDKMVCGQQAQTVMQIKVPERFVSMKFIDVFWTFIHFQVLCMGIYRAPQKVLGSTLPYVYISPTMGTVLASDDRLFVFGSAAAVAKVEHFIAKNRS